MRRLIAILVLVGGGWSPLASLGCPMVSPSEQEQPGAATQPHEARHHDDGHRSAPGDATAETGHHSSSPAPHHSDSDCPLMTTCGGAVLTAARSDEIRAAAPAMTAPMTAPACSLSTFVAANDPPPPRLPA